MDRKRSWVYYLVSALGLPVYLWAFGEQSGRATLPREFPPRDVAYPVRFEGIPAGSAVDLAFIAEGYPPGDEVEIVAADGAAYRTRLTRAFSFPFRLITFVSGLFFWGVAALVFAPRVASPAAQHFFWCTFLYGLAIMVGGVYFAGPSGWPNILGGALQVICLAALPPIFLHLTLIFPRRHRILARHPALPHALYLVAAGLILSRLWGYFRYLSDPGPDAYWAMMRPQWVADALLVLQVTAAFVILFIGARRLELTRERDQIKWLLWGFAIGVTPYVFLRTMLQLVGVSPPLSQQYDRVLEMAIPIAFVFAVVRYQFLDIDIIIRRSVIYAMLALSAVVLYLVFAVLLGGRIKGLPGAWAALLPIAIGVGAGLMFHPLRRTIGRWVDRTFFKTSHGYRQALESLGPRLASGSSQSEIIGIVDRFLGGMLRPKAHAVVLRDGETTESDGTLDGAMIGAALAAGSIPSGTLAQTNTTSLPEIESSAFPRVLAEAGVVLIEPLQAGERVVGSVLLGRRETGRRYVEPDVDLVRAVAAEAARAIERIRLVELAAEEALARRRSDELNRMKSDFLSRVAHDLRTPLASISWSTENLLDGVIGSLNERQQAYLRSVRVATGYLNRLVTNLLEVSRIEQGGGDFPMHSVDLAPVIEQAALAVGPLAEEKHVKLALRIDPDARPVRGNVEKLVEVVLNLVDNAIKYGPEGSTVEIRVSVPCDGAQSFTVRDHGPGLGEADPSALFAQYRQGPPGPRAGRHGFGLGLYIVRTYVERMGGSVRAENHPDGGAIFTCTLQGVRHDDEKRR
jgi:signal transduction histidine kinase